MTQRPPRSGNRPGGEVDQMRRLTLALQRVTRAEELNPLDTFRLLPPQDRFLREKAAVKMFRAGNQALGKTTAGLIEVILRCLGKHPHLVTRKPPIEAWIVCTSWSQSLAIQKKLWELSPKAELAPGQKYNPKTGLGGHTPTLVWANGSIVKFKTSKQDALDFAGATIDVVMFDEPPRSERVFEEAKKRVLKRGGVVLLCMTPINARIDWIREACEAGRIVDLHFRLEPHHLIPVGAASPIRDAHGLPCDAEWIAALRANTPRHEEPVVIDGEWETRVKGRVFDTFLRDKHVAADLPTYPTLLCVGLDHGSRPGRQAAVFVLVDEKAAGEPPDVWIVDEFGQRADATTPEQDARELLHILRRYGWQWSQIDHAYGDRSTSGTADLPGRKGNLEIEDGLVRALREQPGALRQDLRSREQLTPRLRSAKQGAGAGRGAPDLGVRWLYSQFLRGKIHIHPRCVRLIDALETWAGSDVDPAKDIIDALRYALKPWIIRGTGRPAPQAKLTLR